MATLSELQDIGVSSIYPSYVSNYEAASQLVDKYIEYIKEEESPEDLTFEEAPFGVYYSGRREWATRLELEEWAIAEELEGMGLSGVFDSNSLIEMQLEFLHTTIIDSLSREELEELDADEEQEPDEEQDYGTRHK